tara:strand:+ start:226 stop:495 length:270 start_codon:yes stop_codon:yes gene_type:complete
MVDKMKLKLSESNDRNLVFPYNHDDTGKCEMLMDDNKCSVYDKRPLICDVEKMAEYLNLDKEEFYATNNKACNKLMDINNIPQEFRIKI